MKLKYYLRGLGIGIIATVLVLMVTSNGKKDSLTDEEIIARAEELGMVKEERPGGILDKLQENEKNQQQENGSIPDESVPVQEGNGNGQQSDGLDGEAHQPDAQQPVVDIVTLQIGVGEYSDKISEKLFQIGLVDDAEAFNKYLMESGIDGMISVGEYSIPRGSSYQEIAQILSQEPNP